MVDVPDPEDATSFADVEVDVGMPERTERTFRAYADAELSAEKIRETKEEIKRVFAAAPRAAVAVSGGKDSMVTLALAADADCDHRAFHWDWGSRLVPREVEQAVVENAREYVPDPELYVAARGAAAVQPFPAADRFKQSLIHGDGFDAPDGSLDRLAGALAETDHITRQVVGLRAGESGSRDRKLDESGLYGESLGQPAAFPIRDWSARDVWAYIVTHDVPYPDHYDRLACEANDGSPEAYEQARFTTFFDPEFEALAGSEMGIAAWDRRDVYE